MSKIKLESLSKNIVKIMGELSKNEALARLLLNHDENPFEKPVGNNKRFIVHPKNELCRIFPFPFSPEATTESGAFIRVYYNNGEFDGSEVISETQLNIDIVVSKDLWLIHDDDNNSLIRPYEIMSRVVDMIGKRSVNSSIKLKLDGWQHLAVNTKFDAVRLYSEYFTIEA